MRTPANRLIGGATLALIVVTGLAASKPDRRVVDAAQARNWTAVQALIKQKADVTVPQADGATALHWAVHRDAADIVKALLQAGANASAANDLGVTPLELAAENGNAAITGLLLAAKADPNATNQAGETVLMTAAETGNLAVVQALLAQGADPNRRERLQNQTALMWAIAEGHSAITEALVKAGADVHARSKGGSTPLLFAARSGDIASARALLGAGADANDALPDGSTALFIAAGSGHGELGMLLLERGAKPNEATKEEGLAALHSLILKRPLHAANWKRPADDLALAKALLTNGANPNIQLSKPPTNMGINVTGQIWPGATPLMLAARVADLDMMKLLAEHKADSRVVATNKTTALMAAAGVGRSEGNEDPIAEADALAAVKFIHQMGADLDAADTSGVTALHGAVNNGYNDIIQYLFDNGANLNPKDKDGWTPLNVAEIYRNNFREHKESAALLRKLGAIESVPPPSSR